MSTARITSSFATLIRLIDDLAEEEATKPSLRLWNNGRVMVYQPSIVAYFGGSLQSD